jgi:hypothetical protein
MGGPRRPDTLFLGAMPQLARAATGQLHRPAAVLIVGGLILLRAMVLANPLIVPDEYGYLALSQSYPDPQAYYTHDVYMLRLNNMGFLAIGHLMFAVSDAPESLLELVNTLCFMLACLLVLKLMASMADEPVRGGSWLAVLLFPYSCFTANFMPESVYMLVFWTMACTIVLGVPKHPLVGSAVAGVLCAALFLVKAHAIALVPALVAGTSIAAFAGTGWRVRAGIAATLVSAASFYLGVVGLFFVLGGPLEWSLLQLVSGVYRPHLEGALSLDAHVLALGARVTGANLVLLAGLFAPAVLALCWRGALVAFRAWRTRSLTDAETRVVATLAFTIAAMAGLLAMVAKFTADTASRDGMRIWGRYYGFAVPLLLVGYAMGIPQLIGLGRRGTRALGLAGLGSVAAVWLVSRSCLIYPWDDPMNFAFSGWDGRTIVPRLSMAILIAFYASMLVPLRRWVAAYPYALCAVFVLGQLATLGWQKPWSDAMAQKVASGRALRALVPPDELDAGLVVGAHRYHAFSAVLFGLRAPAHVLELPSGAVLDAAVVPADASWVAIFDDYDVRLRFREVFRGRGFLIGRPVIASGAVNRPEQ